MLRRVILNVHLCLGLIAAPVLIVIGLTGAVLVFADPLDRALAPRLLLVTPGASPADLDAIAGSARAAHGGGTLLRLVMPPQVDRSVEVRFDDGMSVFVDPSGARVLGSRKTTGHFVDAILDVHTHLAAGTAGNIVVAIVSVTVLFSAATGVYLWWPRGVWKLVRRRSWRGTNFDLHQVLGFYSFVVLFLVALAGVSIHYNDASGKLIRGALASPAPPPLARVQAPAESSDARISIVRAVHEAQLALPDASPTFIVPGAGGLPVWVQMRFPEDPNPAGRSSVYLDPYDGHVVRALSTRQRDLATAVLNGRRSVHTGEIFGWPSQALVLLSSLALPVEVVTGLLIWWNRRKVLSP